MYVDQETGCRIYILKPIRKMVTKMDGYNYTNQEVMTFGTMMQYLENSCRSNAPVYVERVSKADQSLEYYTSHNPGKYITCGVFQNTMNPNEQRQVLWQYYCTESRRLHLWQPSFDEMGALYAVCKYTPESVQ